jgi:hypothetical protein
LEQANKEIEEGEFGKTENFQDTSGNSPKFHEAGDWRTEDGEQMTEGRKNEKRTQFESQNSEEKMENKHPELNLIHH